MKHGLICLLILFSKIVCAQKQNNHWVFGKGCMVSFNQSQPQSIAGASMQSFEASASVSDPQTGKLLFYSNGDQLYNANHDTMLNGSNLMADKNTSSTQGAVIVPFPGKPSLYFVITTPSSHSSILHAFYSVLDLELDNGKGGVILGKKNIELAKNTNERLTVCINSDSSGYWIVLHEKDNNSFLAFAIDSNGINPIPVVSKLGTVHTDRFNNGIGYMKFNQKRNRIAVCLYSESAVELLDFNACTGEFSNPQMIRVHPNIYGLEFSPSGRYLYVCRVTPNGRLFQFDLNAGDSLKIADSKTLIAEKIGAGEDFYGALQTAPDGKIYMSNFGGNYLSVIQNPNQAGLTCNFIEKALTLSPGTVNQYGLPQALPPIIHAEALNHLEIQIKEKLCMDRTLQMSFTGLNGSDSVKWNFSDTTNGSEKHSSLKNPRHLYEHPGNYLLQLLVHKHCRTFNAAKLLQIRDCSCEYQLTIDDSCLEKNIEFQIQSNKPYMNVRWDYGDWLNANDTSDGLKGQYTYKQSGTYNVMVSADFKCGRDTLYLKVNIDTCLSCSMVYLPLAFSPDGNDINDYFGSVNNCQFLEYKLKVFNRWGELLFNGRDTNHKWDGNFNGKPCPDGVYFYTLEYQALRESAKTMNGIIHLLR